MNDRDHFAPIARFYDQMMEHVNYVRWERIADHLSALVPRPFLHLDVGCGTGVFMELMRKNGWDTLGTDLSYSMLEVAGRSRGLAPLLQSNMCALPFSGSIGMLTCLFDSLNFLLKNEEIEAAFRSFYTALTPGGLAYFDVVTARMIEAHFNNTSWEENFHGFKSKWHSAWDAESRICETSIQINAGENSVTRERIYPLSFLLEAIARSGLTLLAVRDAYSWHEAGRKSVRLEFVAVKGSSPLLEKKFAAIDKQIRRLCGG